jgi:hypothetical protein
MCTWVGNQQSSGVVTARVQTDAVQSLRHQRRDLHQSIYPVPLRRLGLILLSACLLIRYIVSCVLLSCVGMCFILCVIHVTYFVICLNNFVQEGILWESLALQAEPFVGESVAKHDIHL